MASIIRITQAALSTVAGTQDFTIAGFGTPKAALFIVTYATANGTIVNHANIGIGITDGSDERGVSGNAENGQATTDCTRNGHFTKIMRVLQPGTTTTELEISFNSWITNGVRINLDTNPSSSYLCTCVLFGGSDLSTKVEDHSTGAGVYSGVGFRLDAILALANYTSSTSNGDNGGASLGFTYDDGNTTPPQRTLGFNFENGEAAGTPYTALYNDIFAIGFRANNNFEGCTLSSISANGYTATRTYTTSLARNLMYLALLFGDGLDTYVGSLNSPGSTGNWAVSSIGFKPQFVILLLCMNQSENSVVSNSDAGTFAVGVFDKDGNEYCNSVSDEDAAGTSVCKSLSDNKAVNLLQSDGTKAFTATFVSMDANGFTLNFSTVDGTTRKWAVFAVEEGSASASRIPDLIPFFNQRRIRQIAGI